MQDGSLQLPAHYPHRIIAIASKVNLLKTYGNK
jgi:hypothetical protein